ncbi:uncharacterized protein [Nicotiana tomentosiformis]|uniref:uncharacterized protein n=1 Tax=Nicotiana tomentosiformis TaxID=4098 RepID=UPI00388CA81C
MIARRIVASKEQAKKLNKKLQANQAKEPQNSDDSFWSATEGEELVSSKTEHVTSKFPTSKFGSEIVENLKNRFVLVRSMAGIEKENVVTEDIGVAIDNENPSATVAATTIASSSRTVVPLAEKPGKYSGANFKGWQQRVFFWLTTLGMQKFTSEDPPVPAADMPDNEKFMIVEAWKQVDFFCKGYILSALEDDLYNVYNVMNTSKELWDALEKKYKTKDACLKIFVVAKFLDYKIMDSKTVGTQVQELQLIFHGLSAEGMVVNDAFQVAAMIERLPFSWRDFKNYLKHKRKEMKLEDLVICLKIEGDNKIT